MIGLAVGRIAASLAADRQTVMLSAFWTMAAAALFVSVGAWILLAREVRAQRRRRTGPDDRPGDEAADAAGADGADAAGADGADAAGADGADGGAPPQELAGAPAAQETGGGSPGEDPPGAPS